MKTDKPRTPPPHKSKQSFVVSAHLPDDVTPEMMRDYINEAVRVWKRGDPSSPLFYVDAKSVSVYIVRERKRSR